MPTYTQEELNQIVPGKQAIQDKLKQSLAELAAIGTPPYVNLEALGVVANDDDQEVADTNTAIINAAIVTYSGGGARLALPVGDIYLGQAAGGLAWSILFGSGVSNIDLAGQGTGVTRLIQQGPGDGGDWHAILFDRCSSCSIHDFHIEMGIVGAPDSIQLNHLVNVTNSSLDGTGTTDGITGYNLSFGKTVGDCLRFFGDTSPITNIRFNNITVNGDGICIQNWAASTAYPLNSWVINDSGKQYICLTAGTSAASGGPTGTDVSGIVDGSAVWGYKVPREGARSGISIQRGYSNLEISNFYVTGAQNGQFDSEPTGAGGLFAGTEVMEYLYVHDGVIDNTGGNTSVGMSFSGITGSTKSRYNKMANVDIINGALYMIRTENMAVQGGSIVILEPLPNEPNTSSFLIRQVNDFLTVDGLRIERGGTADNGILFDMEEGTNPTLTNFDFKQGTSANPINFEGTDRAVVRSGRIYYSGATPSARDGIYIAAINSSANHPTVDSVVFETASGKFEACVGLYTRSGQSMTNIAISNIQSAGHTNYGVLFSFAGGTTFDSQPKLMNINVGTADLAWRAEDNSAVEITTVRPLIAGNVGDATGIRLLTGKAAPEGAVTAPQGCMYVWINGDSSVLYFKATGTSNTGWVAVS